MPPSPPSRHVPNGELDLIERIRSRAAPGAGKSHALRLGIGDDCAILTPPRGHELLVTTDFSLEGRHFRRSSDGAWHSPASIGHRTLARGLSDLAAMGGKPLAAFLSLALPLAVARNPKWLNEFLDGLLALAALHNVPLAGGDTSQSPGDEPSSNPAEGSTAPILADITLLGSAPAGRALRRSGARPGHLLYVTGALGGASVELTQIATRPPSAHARALKQPLAASPGHPHLFPQPRLAVGQALLRRRLATACIDLSDGLSTDLAHLCNASSTAAGQPLAAEIDAALLPAHPLTAALPHLAQITAVLHGGEDYELLFTAAPATKIPRSIAGVPITRIGRILRRKAGQPLMTVDSGGVSFELQPQGWEHLR